MKAKHPDSILLFRIGDFYQMFNEDAEKAGPILKLNQAPWFKEPTINQCGFVHHALDTYLPKLIRAGQRVAICDQIEAPKETTKRGITETIAPTEKQEVKQEATKAKPEEQTQHQSFHR